MDKGAHFIMYALLGVLLVVGWRWAGRWPRIWWPLLLAIALGAIDELHQKTVGRNAEVADWFADALGVLAGGVIALRYVKRKPPDVV